MNTRITHIFLGLALLATAGVFHSCENYQQHEGFGHRLNISATSYTIEASSTKSLVELGNDIIYAFPFGLSTSSLNGTSISPESMTGGNYSYLMPEATQDIVFTNILDGVGDYTLNTGTSPLLHVSMEDCPSGSESDLVAGVLSKNKIDPDNPSAYHPVDLKRKVARVDIILRSKKKDGQELVADLSDYFSKVELSVSTYSSYSINGITETEAGLSDTPNETYSGTMTSSWTMDNIPSTETLVLAADKFILPSCEEGNPVFTLTLTNRNGAVKTLTSSMTQKILANKHYNLTMTLRQTNSEFGFEIESFINEEMDIDMDMDDLVTLTVTPTISIDMLTKSEGNSVPGFELGIDTLWCYSFSAETDSLLSGFPKAPKLINGTSYQYQIPKGEQRLVFLNQDLMNGTSYHAAINRSNDNYLDLTSNDYTYSNFAAYCMDHTKSGRSFATWEPLIMGNSGSTDNIGDDGLTKSVTLSQVSTGMSVLFEMGDTTLNSLDHWISAAWISLYYPEPYWDLSQNNFPAQTNYRGYEFETEMIPVKDIKMEEIDGKRYFRVCDYLNFFVDDNSDYTCVDVLVLLSDGTTKSYGSFSLVYLLSERKNNNLIIFIEE